MSLRPLVVALVVHASAAVAAPAPESIHLSPSGTAVRGSFTLADKPIPLPEGEFVLVASAVRDARIVSGDISKPRSRLVSVFLAQLDAQRKLHSAVLAMTVLELAGPRRQNWIQEPCRKDDALFRLNLAKNETHGEYADQNCLLVDHRVRALRPNAVGLVKDASAWLANANVEIPVPLLITATITRIDRNKVVQAWYAFNPQAFGCSSQKSQSWTAWHGALIAGDTQRGHFVESVTAWGKAVQQYFDKLIAMRQPLHAELPPASTIYRCAGAVQDAPEKRR